jgi:hypothetical protein
MEYHSVRVEFQPSDDESRSPTPSPPDDATVQPSGKIDFLIASAGIAE